MKIKAENREVSKKKTKLLRENDWVPAVVYGPKRESLKIKVNRQDFIKVYDEAGQNKIIDIEVDGEVLGKNLVREVQYDPVSDEIIHVSFYELDLTKPITAEIPLVTVGLSKAVKDNIGFLVTPIETVEVRCLPEKLPEKIEVDISELDEIRDNVMLRTVDIPDGVELTLDENVLESASAAYIAPPQKEIVEEVEEIPLVAGEGEEGELIGEDGEVIEGEEGEAVGEDGEVSEEGEQEEGEEKGAPQIPGQAA